MREIKTGGRVESFRAPKIIASNDPLYKTLTEPYILLRTREITKMYELPKIHKG